MELALIVLLGTMVTPTEPAGHPDSSDALGAVVDAIATGFDAGALWEELHVIK